MGNTCGHRHAKAKAEFVEIYQVFDGYLGLTIHRRESNVVELHLRRSGDWLPIRVPSDAIMTLWNLGSQPVVMLDWATSEHQSDKALQETIGPVMAMVYNQTDFVITLNPLYVGRQDGFGLIKEGKKLDVHLPIGADGLGERLFFMLQSPKIMEELLSIGIRVVKESEEKTDISRREIHLSFGMKPLYELASKARLYESLLL